MLGVFECYLKHLFLFTLLFCALNEPVVGQENIEEVTVWGRAFNLMGDADSASQGVVGYADFSTRPLMRVGELVEVVPGMIATQHSGSGKANQYFLRGMNLDHGSDFSGRFDGMPLNMRSHAHASGYLDLNIMIPEIVETVEFRKGPYYAEMGDFSAAGGVRFKTYDRFERGFIQADLGDQDDYRLVAGNSHELRNGDLLYAGEIVARDGLWELEQDLTKINAMLKYTSQYAGYDTQVLAMAYDSDWTSTNQIPLRAVESDRTSRFGFIDPELGGNSSCYSLIGKIAREEYSVSAYLSYYELNLINNPTYFLNDPVNGDEFEQEDQRWIYGLVADYEKETELAGLNVVPHFGVELRYDDVQEVNLFNTVARQRINSIREDEVQEFSLSVFAELQIEFTDKLRTNFGLRWDYYDFDVEALSPMNSGKGNDSLLQPKLGVAYAFTPDTELYAK